MINSHRLNQRQHHIQSFLAKFRLAQDTLISKDDLETLLDHLIKYYQNSSGNHRLYVHPDLIDEIWERAGQYDNLGSAGGQKQFDSKR